MKRPDRSDPRTPRARSLRKDATPAERLLWSRLKAVKIAGSHFRRQAPIGVYFADFVCHRTKIVIEIDGGQRGFDEIRQRDERRTQFFKSQGYRVLRFWNHEVIQDLESVLDTIYANLYQTSDDM